MKLARRTFLRLAAGAAALPAAARIATAQTYPARTVRIIVGFAAGGAADIAARLIGQWLSERLGQPFVVENRPGAGGNIATETVVNASPDGYTLLLVNPPSAINVSLYDKLNYDFIRDVAPVAGIIRVANVMLVNPSVPAKTGSRIRRLCQGQPGQDQHGVGRRRFLEPCGRRAVQDAGRGRMVHVPYRGAAPALTDLIGGQVQVLFSAVTSSIETIKSGKVRALAVTTATRSEALPDLPTVADFVAGYEASNWWGIGAPKSTPAAIIEKLNSEINAALADPKMKARLAELGGTMLTGSPADFGKLIADETEKWAKVVKFAGIKPG